MTMAAILVLNAGSSSIKFELFEVDGDELHSFCEGRLEGLGATPRLSLWDAAGHPLPLPLGRAVVSDHQSGLEHILAALAPLLEQRRLMAIGHRVVHGGADFAAPVVVDEAVFARLRALIPLAPLHQPHNLAGIAAARAMLPEVPQIACFDTAFHRSHSWEADTFALPEEYYRRGIRRYGFHGLSYELITSRLQRDYPALAAGRIVIAHLGNGASLCAVRAGRSVESTMGFTALDGLPMGTRCGQLDPGVVLHLIRTEGMSPEAVETLLYTNAGLKGLSGISQDVRDLEASTDPRAAAALSYFVWRVRREIGALAAVLGGLDGLVFTAGIGENAAVLRARICEGLAFLGITLDHGRNARHGPVISAPGTCPVLVLPTDEEGMIARHCLALLRCRKQA